MKYYYLDSNNKKIKLQELSITEQIFIPNAISIIAVKVPPCKSFWAARNTITSIEINSCTKILVPGNKITNIVVPENCLRLDCAYNLLTELIIPNNCQIVDCSNNPITKIFIPKGCVFNINETKLPPYIMDLYNSKDPIKIELANNLQKKF